MKLIAITVLCLLAVNTSRSMPVAENAPQPEAAPAAAQQQLLVVPLEKGVQPLRNEPVNEAMAQEHEHEHGDASAGATARSGSSIEPAADSASSIDAKTKEAPVIEESLKKLEEPVIASAGSQSIIGETFESSHEKKSAIEVPAAPANHETEAIPALEKSIEGRAEESALPSAREVVADASEIVAKVEGEMAQPSEAQQEVPVVKSVPIQEAESSQAAAAMVPSGVQRAIDSEELTKKEDEKEEKETKKEAEGSIEKTDRVTREAEEAAAAAAAKILDEAVATAVIEEKSGPSEVARASEIEKEAIDGEKVIEKKNIEAETSVNEASVEHASGHIEAEKKAIEGVIAEESAASVPQIKRANPIVEEHQSAVGSPAISGDENAAPVAVAPAETPAAAIPSAGIEAKSVALEPKEIKERSEETSDAAEHQHHHHHTATATTEEKQQQEQDSLTTAVKSSPLETDEKSTKSIVPEESKAEELPKPQEVSAAKEPSPKSDLSSNESDESSESNESEEAPGPKHIEHSE